jgi:hypothetical protein
MFSANGSPPALDTAPARHLEIVDDDEPAFQDVGAQGGRFAIGERPPADFDDVGNRVSGERGIVQRQRVDLFVVRAEIAELVHDLHEFCSARRITVRPRRASAGPVAAGAVS